MTRCIAITPSLIVSIIGGSSGAGRLNIIASVSEDDNYFLYMNFISITNYYFIINDFFYKKISDDTFI